MKHRAVDVDLPFDDRFLSEFIIRCSCLKEFRSYDDTAVNDFLEHVIEEEKKEQ